MDQYPHTHKHLSTLRSSSTAWLVPSSFKVQGRLNRFFWVTPSDSAIWTYRWSLVHYLDAITEKGLDVLWGHRHYVLSRKYIEFHRLRMCSGAFQFLPISFSWRQDGWRMNFDRRRTKSRKSQAVYTVHCSNTWLTEYCNADNEVSFWLVSLIVTRVTNPWAVSSAHSDIMPVTLWRIFDSRVTHLSSDT